MNLTELSRILALARAHAVGELEIVYPTGRVRFRCADTASVPPIALDPSAVVHAPAPVTRELIAPAGTPHDEALKLAELFDERRLHLVRAPSVGLFMPLENGDGPLTVGARVTAGDPLGAIKSLGVKRSVIAPVCGLIAAVYVRPGDAVQYGHLIVGIDSGAATQR